MENTETPEEAKEENADAEEEKKEGE